MTTELNTMLLEDKIAELINANEGKHFLYVSKKDSNLSAVGIHCLSACEPDISTTKIILAQPTNLEAVSQYLDGVFVDFGAETEENLRKRLKLNPGAFMMLVKPETREL